MGHVIKKFIQNFYFRKTLIFILIFMLFVLMVWARAFYGSLQAYQKGKFYLEHHQYIRSITFFDRSIHWYTPFNPYVRKSTEHLWEIGLQAEKQEDIKLALVAYRTIRGGLYGVRSFYTPYKGWIKKSDLKINELVLVKKLTKETSDKTSLKGGMMDDQGVDRPNVLWSILLEVGFLGWLGSIIGLITSSRDRKEKGGFITFSSITWICIACGFFVIWILGMIMA